VSRPPRTAGSWQSTCICSAWTFRHPKQPPRIYIDPLSRRPAWPD
jgi:hypothetical protein